MYLTEISSKTGFINIDDIDDGVLAIKEFRAVIENKKLGIECMTAIALTADYKSPIRFYNDEDRPRKAMEESIGDRDKWEWKQELIQAALKKYDLLQYDPSLEERRIHYDRKVKKLKEIKNYDSPPKKDDEGNEIRKKTISTLTAELRSINSDIKEFEKTVEGKDIYSNSPAKGDYKLTRLEQKLEKKNSFYTEIR